MILKIYSWNILKVFVAICISISGLYAQSVPNGFNYQGEVYDASGQPLESGNYDIKFALYLDESDQQPVWGPVNYRLPVYKGVFNVVLEGDDVVAAFDQGAEFIEITIGTNPPIQPRQRILSVPYAMRVRGLNYRSTDDDSRMSLTSGAEIWSLRLSGANGQFQILDENNPAIPAMFFDGLGHLELNRNPATGNSSIILSGGGNHGTRWSLVSDGESGFLKFIDLARPARPALILDEQGRTNIGTDLGGYSTVIFHPENDTGRLIARVNGQGELELITNNDDGRLASFKRLRGGDTYFTLFNEPGGQVPVKRVDMIVRKSTGDFEILSDDATNARSMMKIENASKKVFINGDLVSAAGASFKNDVWAQGFQQTSDARLKTGIETIDNPTGIVKQLRGVKYRWAKDQDIVVSDGQQNIGVLAQEVEEVIPEAVSTAPNGYKHVDYSALTPVLIEAIKVQQLMIEELQVQVRELKGIPEIVE